MKMTSTIKPNIEIPRNIYPVRIPNNAPPVVNTGNVSRYISLEEESAADFYKTVTGARALSLLRHGAASSTGADCLDDIQLKESDGESCPSALNGEITHGRALVNGKVKWVCRCEYSDCAKYKKCLEKFQQWRDTGIGGNNADTRARLSDRSRVLKTKTVAKTETADEIVSAANWNDSAVKFGSEDRPELADFTPVTDYAKDSLYDGMLFAPAAKRVLVNGGAGSGKTFACTLRREILRGRNVLYLTSGGGDGTARGFDEFYLKYGGELNPEIPPLQLLQRCENYFGSLQCVIVDNVHLLPTEQLGILHTILQYITGGLWSAVNLSPAGGSAAVAADTDLAGSLAITEIVTCGYFLAGDFGITEDFSRFEPLFTTINADRDTRKFLLAANMRYAPPPAADTNTAKPARVAQLIKNSGTPGEIRDLAGVHPLTLEQLMNSADAFAELCGKGETTAIVCFEKGGAEAISTILRRLGIGHALAGMRVTTRALADMLWDYRGDTVNKNTFAARYTTRVNSDGAAAYALFNSIMDYSNGFAGGARRRTNILRMSVVRSYAAAYAAEAEKNRKVTVGYVRDIAGGEFDRVYVPEPRVCGVMDLYNTVTRAKTEFSFLKKEMPINWEFNETETPAVENSAYPSAENTAPPIIYSGRPFVKKILINGQTKPSSFISGGKSEEQGGIDTAANENQQYISQNVKRGDPLEICRGYAREYNLTHNGRVIGQMRDDFADILEEAILSADKLALKGATVIPNVLRNVYADRITTETGMTDIRFYRDSGLWLGVRVFGMADAVYDYYN